MEKLSGNEKVSKGSVGTFSKKTATDSKAFLTSYPEKIMKTIFLSAGHSTTDAGAVAYGRTEADIVEDFRNIVSRCLSDASVAHTVDGKGDANIPLRDAVTIAAKHDIAVEFHCNASSNKQAGGVETLSGPKHMALGARLCHAISSTLGISNRGAKPENAGQHHRLAFVSTGGGIIVELFFLTNPNNLYSYEERKWAAARAVALVLAVEAAKC
jgi:N-acetylmuramoyl-L-alanine amidase